MAVTGAQAGLLVAVFVTNARVTESFVSGELSELTGFKLLLTIFTLAGAALAQAFVYVRCGLGWRLWGCFGGACVSTVGWVLLCVNEMGTASHGVGTVAFIAGSGGYSLLMLSVVEGLVDPFVLSYGVGLAFSVAFVALEVSGDEWLAACFEWAGAVTNSVVLFAFYAMHSFEGPAVCPVVELVPLLPETVGEGWV
jgi:hypothetical protein